MNPAVTVVRTALIVGTIALVPASVAGYAIGGRDVGLSVFLALAIVLANTALAAWISAIAMRWTPAGGVLVAMPSAGIRLAGILWLFLWLEGQAFVHRGAFAAAFAASVTAAIVLEMIAWRRTPWLALTFKEGS